MSSYTHPGGFSTQYVNVPLQTEQPKSRRCCTCRCCSFFTLILIIIFLLLIMGGAFYVVKGLVAFYLVNTCRSEECLRSVVEIYNFIDPKVNPCEDFHAFACGKYLNSSHLGSLTSPGLTQLERIQNEIDAFITEPQSEVDSNLVVMQKRFFHVCMDVASLDDHYHLDDDKNLKLWKIIDEIFGGWPLLLGSEWNELKFDWVQATISMKEAGIPFQWFYVFGISKTLNRNYLKITSYQDCHKLTIMTDDEDYFRLMEEVIVALTEIKHLTAKKKIEKMFPFIKKFAEICYDHDDEDVSPDTLENFKYQFLLRFNLFDFVNKMTYLEFNSTKMVRIDHNIKDYSKQLDDLFTMFTKRDQANYLIWRLIEYYGHYLSAPVRKHFQAYTNTKHPNRFEFCMSDTKHRFPFLSETEFIRKSVNNLQSKKNIEEIFNYTKDALIIRIGDSDYLQGKEKWRRENIAKVDNIRLVIGGQDEIFKTIFETEYLEIGDVNFGKDEPFEMLAEINKAHWEVVFNSIGGSPIINDYFSQPELYERNVMITGFYNDSEKYILIPAGLLSGFYYNQWRHNCFNYATLAPFMGELLTTALNITPLIFMGENKKKNYECLEKFGEFSGANLAYEGFKLRSETNAFESRILPVKYTFKQLFWIKYGMQWCTRVPSYVPNLDDPNLHVFNRNRINFPLKNSNNFKEDFKCGKKAKMNPSQKCKLI